MRKNEEDEITFVTKTVFDAASGLPLRQETRLNGALQAPPDGSPSTVRYRDGQPTQFEWHENNLEHRTVGPARLKVDALTGRRLLEVFKIKGQPRSPEHGPFRVWYNEQGEVSREAFAKPGDFLPDETIEYNRSNLEP